MVAPLFLASLEAGAAWALLVRRFARLPAVPPAKVRAFDYASKGLLVIGILICLASFLFDMAVSTLSGAGGLPD